MLIPAFNEAANVPSVVRVALEAALGPVLVVDDGSGDATALAAERAGATVLRLPRNEGKGGALFAGARALSSDVVVLVDADLLGLRPEHLRDLALPVLRGEVEMTRGVFAGGRWRTTAAQRLTPQLNGQRALKRELLLSVPGLKSSRYGVEIAITEHAKRSGWRVRDVPLAGVSQVMKEEKRGFWQGVAMRLKMYAEILWELVRSALRAP
ncbi:glycosyl transferase family 2 [Truepera radiovictrix DSM 17093]|uniref:Glycosyl transferase family 2 n=1 Tax=Truepera radiovictrix (strain DSM 17093 / CIP 108686 / LMG 22925 / RQ-24) TaxID=649638 RepID=D7CRQ4_TRURR|nr:glycosyl transferase family 2 [Truepera radiovictrix DSM 17093]